MLEEWKASTDRSLANTESILRSLGSRPSYAKPAIFTTSENIQLFPSHAGPAINLERPKPSLSGDIDRLIVQVKQELDSRLQAHQAKLDEFRNEIHSEVAARVVSVEEECTELKRRLTEEREKRSKLEKHMGGLLRWQEEAKYAMEDLRRKIEDAEESRSTDKRDLRKEFSKREEQTNAVHVEMRKDLDYLRSCVVGKGAGKDGSAGEPSMRTIEQSLASMHERCDKVEQLAVSTKRDAAAALDNVQHDLDQKLRSSDSKLEMHESKLLTLTEALNATKGQVQEATLVADKLHNAVVDGREQTQALQELVKAVERKATTHEASIDRAQGMVKEVVHVIGAMSARLTEQLGTSTDPQHAPPAVASKVEELQALYEERFKDITAMIRHIGVTVRAQHLSMAASGPADDGDGMATGRAGVDGSKLEGDVLEQVMEEIRKTKSALEGDLAALRAYTQQAVGGEGDLWQLQDDVTRLNTQVGPLKQQLTALQQQVHSLGAEVSALSDKDSLMAPLLASRMDGRDSMTLQGALDAINSSRVGDTPTSPTRTALSTSGGGRPQSQSASLEGLPTSAKRKPMDEARPGHASSGGVGTAGARVAGDDASGRRAGGWIPEKELEKISRAAGKAGPHAALAMFEVDDEEADASAGEGAAGKRRDALGGGTTGARVGLAAGRSSDFVGSMSIAGIPQQAQRLKVDDVLAQVNFNLTASESDSQDDEKFDFSH